MFAKIAVVAVRTVFEVDSMVAIEQSQRYQPVKDRYSDSMVAVTENIDQKATMPVIIASLAILSFDQTVHFAEFGTVVAIQRDIIRAAAGVEHSFTAKAVIIQARLGSECTRFAVIAESERALGFVILRQSAQRLLLRENH